MLLEYKLTITCAIIFVLTVIAINADRRPDWAVPDNLKAFYGLLIVMSVTGGIGCFLVGLWK